MRNTCAGKSWATSATMSHSPLSAKAAISSLIWARRSSSMALMTRGENIGSRILAILGMLRPVDCHRHHRHRNALSGRVAPAEAKISGWRWAKRTASSLVSIQLPSSTARTTSPAELTYRNPDVRSLAIGTSANRNVDTNNYLLGSDQATDTVCIDREFCRRLHLY